MCFNNWLIRNIRVLIIDWLGDEIICWPLWILRNDRTRGLWRRNVWRRWVVILSVITRTIATSNIFRKITYFYFLKRYKSIVVNNINNNNKTRIVISRKKKVTWLKWSPAGQAIFSKTPWWQTTNEPQSLIDLVSTPSPSGQTACSINNLN